MATVVKYATSRGEQRWEVRYRKPDRSTTRKRGFRRKLDAQRFADQVAVDIRAGAFVAASAGRVTVAELVAAHIERQRGVAAPASVQTWDSHYRTWIEGTAFGAAPVGQLRRTGVQAFVTEIAQQRGPETTRGVWKLVSATLESAVEDGLIGANPAHGVKLPRITATRKAVLSVDQVLALADEAPERYRSWVLLAGFGGLRAGELAALQAEDIDGPRVHVQRSAARIGGEMVVGPTKGGRSRVVVVPRVVAEALAERGLEVGGTGLLWPARDGGPLRPFGGGRSWLTAAVERCCQRDAAFPRRVNPHLLRHSAASIAIATGASVVEVQTLLGHGSGMTTLGTYVHAFEGAGAALAARLDASIEGAKMRPKRLPDVRTVA